MTTARHATIAGVVVLDLLKALQRVRVQPAPLCRAVGLDVSSLDDPNARVSTALVTRILALAEQRSLDPWIGLHAGEHAEPRGPLFYMLLSSPRVMEGLRRAQHFSGLVIDSLRLTTRTQQQMLNVIFEPGDPVFAASRHAMEYLLMTGVSSLRHAVGASVRLREVSFRHRRSGKIGEAERAFGCPVYFAQPDDRQVFPLSTLWVVPRFANRAIGEQIEKFAAALNARITARVTVSEHAERAMRTLLASGVRASSASVARRLGMTGRTLQRKLALEGTTFRALRDATLWEAVEVLLSNPSLKIEAIALSVGFSDVAAFSKAFRRWKGYPPTRHRENVARPKAASLPASGRSGAGS
jgi:AraC-like DNA-binding protein